MMEPFEGQDPLLAIPGVWNRLQRSGFFLVDHVRGVMTPSRFMAALGFRAADFQGQDFIKAIHPADQPAYRSLWARVTDGRERP